MVPTSLNGNRPTLVQKWTCSPSRRKFCGFLCLPLLLLTAHAILAIISVFLSSPPDLVLPFKCQGSRCKRDPNAGHTWYRDLVVDLCGAMGQGETAPLKHTEIGFRFPKEDDPGYSWLSWRVLAGLVLDVTFHGADVPNSSSIKSNNGSTKDADLDSGSNNSTETTPIFRISERSFSLSLRAVLKVKSDGDGEWKITHDARLRRTLTCSLSEPMEDLVSSASMALTAQYICSISPMLDLHFPASGGGNTSYILNVEFHNVQSTMNASETESAQFLSNPSEAKASLVMSVGNHQHKEVLLYLKCLFCPMILLALLWFVYRLYANDLYIAIPDRALAATALALFMQDLPTTEILVLMSANPSPYLKMLDILSCAAFLCSILFFWVVFAQDKLAKNEPWERNTRYYWKEVLLISLGSLFSILYSVFSLMPGMSSPFASNWSSDDSDSDVAVALSFSVVALALLYQTYYAVIVFKILCFAPATRYPLPVNTSSDCGTRLVLTFSLLISASTCAWLTLNSAVDMELNRGQQMKLESSFNPMLAYVAGVLDIVVQGAWNLHVLSLLILLSRVSPLVQSKNDSFDEANVKPVSYNSCEREVKEYEDDDPTTTEQLMQLSSNENNNNSNNANIYLWQAQHYVEEDVDEDDQSPEHTFLEDNHYRHEYYVQDHQQQQPPRYYYYDDCLKEEEDEDDYCCEQDPKHLVSSNSSSSCGEEDDAYEVDGYESSLGPVVSPSLSADSRIYYRTCSR